MRGSNDRLCASVQPGSAATSVSTCPFVSLMATPPNRRQSYPVCCLSDSARPRLAHGRAGNADGGAKECQRKSPARLGAAGRGLLAHRFAARRETSLRFNNEAGAKVIPAVTKKSPAGEGG